jgi:hypothetical protein
MFLKKCSPHYSDCESEWQDKQAGDNILREGCPAKQSSVAAHKNQTEYQARPQEHQDEKRRQHRSEATKMASLEKPALQ